MKFVYMSDGGGYFKCLVNAVGESRESFFFLPFKSRIISGLFNLHNAWHLNKRVELPLKRVWFSRCLKGVQISDDEEVYFILYENFRMTYSIAFLRFLRAKFKRAKLCFNYVNPVNEYRCSKVKKITPYLDAIITLNKDDAKKFGYYYYYFAFPYKAPIYYGGNLRSSDLFFVGSEKGRLNRIIDIFEKLTAVGLKCDFHIVDVPEEKQKYKESIVYNQRLSYREVLERVNATRCVLEIIQEEKNYISLRTIEAMQYHRKLLTDNMTIREADFYNPEVIQVFDDPKDIDIDFIRSEVNESSYPDYIGSLKQFEDFCIRHIK